MASNNNNQIRETDNNKRHFNLTMDDLPDGTINNPIDLLLRAGNRTDLSKLLFFIQSPGLIGSEEFLQWAANADPAAVNALNYYRRHRRDQDHVNTSSNDNHHNINMARLEECYGEIFQGDNTHFISNMEHPHEFLSYTCAR